MEILPLEKPLLELSNRIAELKASARHASIKGKNSAQAELQSEIALLEDQFKIQIYVWMDISQVDLLLHLKVIFVYFFFLTPSKDLKDLLAWFSALFWFRKSVLQQGHPTPSLGRTAQKAKVGFGQSQASQQMSCQHPHATPTPPAISPKHGAWL